MTARHGRSGGRWLEVGLALGLAVLSAGVFRAGLALVLWVLMAVYLLLFRVSPILASGIMAGGAGISVKVAGPVMKPCWKGLAAIWRPFLAYTGHEAHTLLPLTENESATPGDGHGTIKGRR